MLIDTNMAVIRLLEVVGFKFTEVRILANINYTTK